MHLNTIIPHTRCYVRRAFLMAGACPADQIVECELIGAQSNIGRPIQFHAFMRDGATFWNLPIHAFCWHQHPTQRVTYNDAPTNQQLWDCPTSTMVCTVWPRLVGLRCTMRTLAGEVGGEYRMSFDWFHADPSIPMPGPIDIPNERKVAHLIAGDNGLYFALPNNHIVWMDPSWVIESPPSKEDYRAIDKSYRCEHKFKIEDTVAAAYDIVRMADTNESFENAAGEALSTIWREGSGDPIDAEFTITPDPKETPANGDVEGWVDAMGLELIDIPESEIPRPVSILPVLHIPDDDLHLYPKLPWGKRTGHGSEGLRWLIKSDATFTDGWFVAEFYCDSSDDQNQDLKIRYYRREANIPF